MQRLRTIRSASYASSFLYNLHIRAIQHTGYKTNLKSIQVSSGFKRFCKNFINWPSTLLAFLSSLSSTYALTYLRVAKHKPKGHLSSTASYEWEVSIGSSVPSPLRCIPSLPSPHPKYVILLQEHTVQFSGKKKKSYEQAATDELHKELLLFPFFPFFFFVRKKKKKKRPSKSNK